MFGTEDGGASWSDERKVSTMTGTSSPSVAVGASGTVYVTWESGDRSAMAESSDGGDTFGGHAELLSPDGYYGYATLATDGGRVVAVGTSSGAVWVDVIE